MAKKKARKPQRSKEREKFIGFHGSLQISQQLNEIAKAEDRPVASVLRRIVSDYLRGKKSQ
jgi:hypothetical protein